MQGAGDSDSGGLDKAAPSEDTAIELRKSCDYCVRLKRACDGKNPCSLCCRRHKLCTRSARKKSGPAKGTKYAPRRKRSAIAEWADRAAVGVREPLQRHELSRREIGGGEMSRVGHQGPVSFLSTGSGVGSSSFTGPLAPLRRGSEAWGDPASISNPERQMELGPPSSRALSLPFPLGRTIKQEASSGQRRLAPRLEPAASLTRSPTDALSRRHVWVPPPLDTRARSGLRHPEQGPITAAESAVPLTSFTRATEGRSDDYSNPRLPPSMGMDSRQGRPWEHAAEAWASPPDHYTRQGDSAHGKRLRLSPPRLSAEAGRHVPRQAYEAYPHDAPSRLRGRAGSAGAKSSDQPSRESDPESPSSFRPSPREPPHPTAGFTFRPAVPLLPWRRSSTLPPLESRDDSAVLPRALSPPPGYSDRGTAWTSGGGAGSGGGEYVGNRRYREEYTEVGDAHHARRQSDSHFAAWPRPSETEPYRERFESTPAYAYEHRRPRERPLAGSDEREGEGEISRGSSSGRRNIYARAGGAGAGAYERQLERSIGRLPPAHASDEADSSAGRGSRESVGRRDEQQRLEGGQRAGISLPHRHQTDWNVDSYFPEARMAHIPSLRHAEYISLSSGRGGSTGSIGRSPEGALPRISSDVLERARRPPVGGAGGDGSDPYRWESDRREVDERGPPMRRGSGGGSGGAGGPTRSSSMNEAVTGSAVQSERHGGSGSGGAASAGGRFGPQASVSGSSGRHSPAGSARASGGASSTAIVATPRVQSETQGEGGRPELPSPRAASAASDADSRASEPPQRGSSGGEARW